MIEQMKKNNECPVCEGKGEVLESFEGLIKPFENIYKCELESISKYMTWWASAGLKTEVFEKRDSILRGEQ